MLDLYFSDSLYLNVIPKMKHDKVAVNILDVINKSESLHLKFPSIAADTETAKIATKHAATIACTYNYSIAIKTSVLHRRLYKHTCTKPMFPTTILNISFRSSSLPKLACVESLEAKHMSKFPFKPSMAGTNMNNALTS